MPLIVDIKYAKLAGSPALELFSIKQETPFLANGRCCYCGDSKKSKIKARGYFYQHNDTVLYRCHNCGVGVSLKTFLYDNKSIPGIDALLRDYIFENFGDYKPRSAGPIPIIEEQTHKKRFDGQEFPRYVECLLGLQWFHPARKYVSSRKIPLDFHSLLYYTDDFFRLANDFIPGKFDDNIPKDERLIIPFFNVDYELIAFQGRALTNVEPRYRYFTIALDKSQPLMFGLHRVDFNKTVYVVEGPIDSMFLPNAIGLAKLQTSTEFQKDNTVFVYDFEPRHKDVTKEVRRKIRDGYKVCMMPDYISNYFKDINDLIKAGYSRESVKNLVDKYTYQGDLAVLEFSQWNKT